MTTMIMETGSTEERMTRLDQGHPLQIISGLKFQRCPQLFTVFSLPNCSASRQPVIGAALTAWPRAVSLTLPNACGQSMTRRRLGLPVHARGAACSAEVEAPTSCDDASLGDRCSTLQLKPALRAYQAKRILSEEFQGATRLGATGLRGSEREICL